MNHLSRAVPSPNLFARLSAGLLLASALFASGCVVHGSTGVRASAHVVTPDLVEVRPGLWVVEDYHQPVFYANSHYWLYDDGLWYRSHVHYGSWSRVRYRAVPVVVRGIDKPRVYVRYRSPKRRHVTRTRARSSERVNVQRRHAAPKKPTRVHRSTTVHRSERKQPTRVHRSTTVQRSERSRSRSENRKRDQRTRSAKPRSNERVRTEKPKKSRSRVRDHRKAK